MQDNRAEQIEALNTAKDYCTRLYKGVNALADELRTGRLPDTEEYMKTVINGINWVFEVYNATKDLINEDCDYIDKDKVNAGAVELGKAVADNDDEKVADKLENVIAPFILDFQKAVDKVNEAG